MTTLTNDELLAIFDKSLGLINRHRGAGHGLDNPKFVTDLGSLITNARRLRDRIEPPASEREQLSYIVANLLTREQMEQIAMGIAEDIQTAADATGAAANAAANRVIAAFNANNSVIAELQAKSAADDVLIADLQAQIASGTVTPEAAQAVIDSLSATNAKLADLDSDPVTPI